MEGGETMPITYDILRHSFFNMKKEINKRAKQGWEVDSWEMTLGNNMVALLKKEEVNLPKEAAYSSSNELRRRKKEASEEKKQ